MILMFDAFMNEYGNEGIAQWYNFQFQSMISKDTQIREKWNAHAWSADRDDAD